MVNAANIPIILLAGLMALYGLILFPRKQATRLIVKRNRLFAASALLFLGAVVLIVKLIAHPTQARLPTRPILEFSLGIGKTSSVLSSDPTGTEAYVDRPGRADRRKRVSIAPAATWGSRFAWLQQPVLLKPIQRVCAGSTNHLLPLSRQLERKLNS